MLFLESTRPGNEAKRVVGRERPRWGHAQLAGLVGMPCVEILLCCLLLLGLGNQQAAASSPPVPSWPDQFSVQLTIYVEQYGSNWQTIGAMYYNYTQKVCY